MTTMQTNDLPPSNFPTAGNATGLVEILPTSGKEFTYLRSDGSPGIDAKGGPYNWKGHHTFSVMNIFAVDGRLNAVMSAGNIRSLLQAGLSAVIQPIPAVDGITYRTGEMLLRIVAPYPLFIYSSSHYQGVSFRCLHPNTGDRNVSLQWQGFNSNGDRLANGFVSGSVTFSPNSRTSTVGSSLTATLDTGDELRLVAIQDTTNLNNIYGTFLQRNLFV